MSAVATIDKSEISLQLSQLLIPEHEIFCNECAAGVPVGQAAVNAGFCAGYGTDLLAKDNIRNRIQELLAQRELDGGGVATRAWIETQMVFIVRQSLVDAPPTVGPDGVTIRPARAADLNLALTALNSLAKFKGFIVDKSSKLNLTADLSKLPPTQLAAAIDQRLQSLAPGARKKIEQLQAQVIEAEDTEEL